MWLPINETHEVSVNGEIRNRKSGRLLKPYLCGKYVMFRFGFNKPKYYVHRIVAEVFLPAPTENCIVDHINRDRMDNRAENLRWVSRSVNNMNRTIETKVRPGHTNEHHHIHRSGGRWAFKIRLNGKDFYKRFDEIADAISFRDEYIKQCHLA